MTTTTKTNNNGHKSRSFQIGESPSPKIWNCICPYCSVHTARPFNEILADLKCGHCNRTSQHPELSNDELKKCALKLQADGITQRESAAALEISHKKLVTFLPRKRGAWRWDELIKAFATLPDVFTHDDFLYAAVKLLEATGRRKDIHGNVITGAPTHDEGAQITRILQALKKKGEVRKQGNKSNTWVKVKQQEPEQLTPPQQQLPPQPPQLALPQPQQQPQQQQPQQLPAPQPQPPQVEPPLPPEMLTEAMNVYNTIVGILQSSSRPVFFKVCEWLHKSLPTQTQ
jgi:hypothetical protein